jgi:hypothetical protein
LHAETNSEVRHFIHDKLDFEFVTQDFLKGETKKTRRSTKKGGGAGKELVKG